MEFAGSREEICLTRLNRNQRRLYLLLPDMQRRAPGAGRRTRCGAGEVCGGIVLNSAPRGRGRRGRVPARLVSRSVRAAREWEHGCEFFFFKQKTAYEI